jgi:PPP family 3-phenylpropionic acid transporter
MAALWSPTRLAACRVGFAYATLFTVNAAGMAWLPVWLESRGLSGPALGLVIAASMFARVVATPAAGVLADRAARWRAALVAAAIALLVAHLLFPVADRVWVFALIALVMGAGIGPAVPVLEMANVRLAQQGGPSFGPMRAVGTLAFIVTTIALGELVGLRGPDVVITWSVVGSAAFLLAASLVPVPAARSKNGEAHQPMLPALCEPGMLLALAASTLIQASHAFYYGFASLLWREQGLSDTTVGVLWAWSAAIEIAVLLAARRLEPVSAASLLLIGAGCATARWIFMGLEPGLFGLALLQMLHAATFGVAHLGIVHYVRDRAPAYVGATALSLNSALTFGVGLGIATVASGVLYDQVAARGYWVMAALAAAGLAIAGALRMRLRSNGP